MQLIEQPRHNETSCTGPEDIFAPTDEFICVEVANLLNPRGHSCNLVGLNIVAMPPGRVHCDFKDMRSAYLNVVPNKPATFQYHRVNGHDAAAGSGMPAGFEFYAPLDRYEIECVNPGWEVLLELDPEWLPLLAQEKYDGEFVLERPNQGGQDPPLATLAGLVVNHLRSERPDRLYVECLASALSVRAMAVADVQNGRFAPDVPTAGTDSRIARAVDFIEAHLVDDLSLAFIASAARMSPSWLKTSFKAVTGRPVWAYVKERRLERARLLLADRNYSLTQIAYACGFSSHSHMSRAFKQQFGATPSDMRAQEVFSIVASPRPYEAAPVREVVAGNVMSYSSR